MREIEFRAWHNEKMRYQLFSNEYAGISAFIASLYDKGFIDEDTILMQFIGIMDSGGKRVYEGDIIQICQHNEFFKYRKGKVIFKDGGYCIVFNGIKGLFNSTGHNEYLYFNSLSETSEFYVVGNTLENKDEWNNLTKYKSYK